MNRSIHKSILQFKYKNTMTEIRIVSSNEHVSEQLGHEIIALLKKHDVSINDFDLISKEIDRDTLQEALLSLNKEEVVE